MARARAAHGTRSLTPTEGEAREGHLLSYYYYKSDEYKSYSKKSGAYRHIYITIEHRVMRRPNLHRSYQLLEY